MQIQQISDTEPTQAELEADFAKMFGGEGRLLSGFKESTPWQTDQFGNLCRSHGDLS